MLGYLHVPLSWTAVLERTGSEALQDDVFDLAAQQAYYFFFALFPALLFVMAVASFFPVQDLIDTIVAKIAQIAPGDAVTLLRETLKSIAEQNSGGILTFAFLVTIWS